MANNPIDQRLVQLIRRLSFARDLQAVMDYVKVSAREITGADGITFVLRDGDLCFYAEESAIAPLWKGNRFPMSACISGWVMLQKSAAVIEDIYSDSRIPADAYRPTFVKSLAMVPVRAADPIAAVGAYWATRRLPSDEEVLHLQTIADTAAVAIDNIQLYANLNSALEREKEARLEAERANRAKDEFLSVVSHELRTPLTPMVGWLRLIDRSQVNLETRHALEAVERSVDAQRRVVESLLDFSQLTTGQTRVELAPIKLSTPVLAALETLKPAAAARHINIVLDCAEGIRVNGDTERLRQVAWHLLSNAIKFSPPDSTVHITLSEEDLHAVLIVEDSGEGIEADYLPRIFTKFSQADYGITRRHGGLGLGLAMVHHLIELHGGRVNAQSAGKDKGARFTVTLPRLQPAANVAPLHSGERKMSS